MGGRRASPPVIKRQFLRVPHHPEPSAANRMMPADPVLSIRDRMALPALR